MTNSSANLRKAAILIRGLDDATAASMLGQLPPDEAAALRAAIRELGPVDPDEEADVVAEFRRVGPLVGEPPADGVELRLTSQQPIVESQAPIAGELASLPDNAVSPAKRFEFLEHARVDHLASCLAREHAQTIAVVLSYMAPARAATILSALPARLQADTLERLASLSDSDPDSVTVLERELAAWVAKQSGSRRNGRRGDTATAILAAADDASRRTILDSLKSHKRHLSERYDSFRHAADTTNKQQHRVAPRIFAQRPAPKIQPPRHPAPVVAKPSPPVRFDFNDLARLAPRELAAVMQAVDPKVLVLALAGSSDELVDRITAQMPKPVAKAFHRELRRLGPTRLSDVEAAQRAVARAAADRCAGVLVPA